MNDFDSKKLSISVHPSMIKSSSALVSSSFRAWISNSINEWLIIEMTRAGPVGDNLATPCKQIMSQIWTFYQLIAEEYSCPYVHRLHAYTANKGDNLVLTILHDFFSRKILHEIFYSMSLSCLIKLGRSLWSKKPWNPTTLNSDDR